ncbi:antitoxin VbhA family protein [Aminobacterium colombiense]|uniref:antitoxin VbhA family protein n=1 Tax=Aminobacterium colombiense TaxID=81468 RepID=UPI0025956133|nr:antitoxin VbhA family protein [uncultured Aminobacterium sp.]
MGLKPFNFYLTEELDRAINIKMALTGQDRSGVVREALTKHLTDALEILERMEEKELTKEQKAKKDAWDFGIGMVQIDNMKPSPELREMIKKEIQGEITMEEIDEALYELYRVKEND